MTFHKPMIAVHGYDNIRELLVKHGDTFSDRPLTIINGVFNKGKGICSYEIHFFLKFASNQLNSKLVTIPSKYFVNQFYNVYKHLISPLKKWGSLEKKNLKQYNQLVV